MRFTELICRQALLLAQTQARLGVRLSPVHLEPEEASQLVEVAREILGERWFVAVAVPGAEPALGERFCIDAGERAAEYATRWRNTIDPTKGERVLYVSVEQQGKAGGLQDTLMALNEEALQAGFTTWLQGSELPAELSKALTAAGVTEQASARSLCHYSELILAEKKPERRWKVAGEQLPVVSLAKDSKLQSAPEARLKGNKRLVQRAALSERQSSSLTSKASKAEKTLKETLRGTQAPEEALRDLDLGGLSVQDLDSDIKKSARKAAPAPKPRPTPPPAKPSSPKTPSSGKQTKPEPPPAPRSQEEALTVVLEDAPSTSSGASAEGAPASSLAGRPSASPALLGEKKTISTSDQRASLRVSEPQSPALGAPTAGAVQLPVAEPAAAEERSTAPGSQVSSSSAALAVSEPPTTPAADEQQPWTESMQRREFGVLLTPLPKGVAAMLDALLVSPAGLSWTCTGSASSLLQRLPQTLKDPEIDSLEPPEGAPWAAALHSYRAARRSLVDVLRSTSHRSDHLLRLICAPLLALSERSLRAAAEAYITAIEDLYAAIIATGDAELTRRVLALETCSVHSSSGEALCLLSPLHPLWLGQALARYGALLSAADLSPVSRRLVARALSQAPLAPDRWPLAGVELRRGLPFAGLPCFETAPTGLPEAGLRSLSARLVSLFLSAAPYARTGLLVAVRAQSPEPILEGLADVLGEDQAIQRIDVQLERGGVTAPLEPRLRLLPTSLGQSAAAPHIHITVRDQLPRLASEQGDLPVPEQPLLTARRAVSSGILAVTSVAGVPGLSAVERALACVRGESPRGAFVELEAAASVREVIPPEAPSEATWRTAVAPTLSPQLSGDALLLVHERLGGLDVAVVAGDERAPARRLAGALRSIGVQDTRPGNLASLTRRLAGCGGGGILTLDGDPERQLGNQILSAKLAEAAGEGAVAALIRGSVYPALLGSPDDDPWGSFGISVAHRPGGGLRAAIGYVALQQPLAVDLSGSRISGELWDRLTRLADVVKLAMEDSLGGAAAREALGAILWPAIAAEPSRPEKLSAVLAGLGPETPLELSILCLLPSGHALTEERRETVIRGTSVEILAVDAELMRRLLLGKRR